MQKHLFTSESLTDGHSDKMCDQISETILNAIIAQDPNCRVACETIVTTGMFMLLGEITAECYVDIPKIARKAVEEIGYCDADFGFNGKTYSVIISIDKQWQDIVLGVNNSLEIKTCPYAEEDMNGAGDQDMMFGYACDETAELMPMPISLAHKLAMKLSEMRKSGEVNYIGPDGKTQVTVVYADGVPTRVDTIIVSTQHSAIVDITQLHKDIITKVIFPTIPTKIIDNENKIYINPTGRFVIGRPQGDSGLTGRKIIVDTYGGYARHGGGAFSGKDPTKVDRSAAYAARYVAKNILASELAKKCEIQIAYAIDISHPVLSMIDTFGTGVYPDSEISESVNIIFDLRFTAIIKYLDLRKPIYQKLVAFGHMGREDLDVRWEKIDKVDELKKYFNIV